MSSSTSYSKIITLFLIVIFLLACSSEKITKIQQIYNDGEYDTQFPSEEASEFIGDISRSIKLLSSLTFYKQYKFQYSDNITQTSIKNPAILNRAISVGNFNKSSSGTATIIGLNMDKILFLTAAHIVLYPDTIYTYYANELGQPSTIIESISIKESQQIYAGEAGISDLEIVLGDQKKDIAFVGGSFDRTFFHNYSVFDYSIGKSQELEWGDFVYVFGYPMHYKILTRGIVSIVDSENDYFMVDVSVNRGSSGGIVLALRDGIPNFELVGLISWVPAERTKVLVPKTLYNNKSYQLDAQYSGDVFISELENVKYGITRVISIQAVTDLLEDNYNKLQKEGYDISSFKHLFSIN